eukprot:TRINITY_DN12624_c2_g1_i2.p1 TRINITY_DN12624_c2_g1~~TRINITY_DN12624_c2_g1_i2.p1  ORF type:complete len:1172 (+),score=305.31 TRINITY_DN12624_c2_g1_i2:122-3637(+)
MSEQHSKDALPTRDSYDGVDDAALEAISDGSSLLEQLSRETIDLSIINQTTEQPVSQPSNESSRRSIIVANTVVTPEQSEDEGSDDEQGSEQPPSDAVAELVYGDERKTFKIGHDGIPRGDVLASFALPLNANLELQDENEHHVALEEVKAGSSLNLIIRRSRRQDRKQPAGQGYANTAKLRLSAGLEFVQSRLLAESRGDVPRTSDPEALAEFNAVWESLKAELEPDVGPKRSSSFHDGFKPGDRSSRASTLSGTLAMRELKLKLQKAAAQDAAVDAIHVDYEPATTVVLSPGPERLIGLTLKQLYIQSQTELPMPQEEGTLPQHVTRLQFLNTNVRLSNDGRGRPFSQMQSRIFVASLDQDSEAMQLGIRSGDLVLSINGSSVLDLTLEDVESLIQFSTGKLILEICHLEASNADISALSEADELDITVTEDEDAATAKIATMLGEEVQRASALNMQMQKSGLLVVKHVLEAGGARRKKRHWKEYFVTLRGHMLYLFTEKDKMDASMLAAPKGGRISVKSSICDIAHGYRKHPHVFKLQAFNGSEYLMRAGSKEDMFAWIKAIQDNSNPDQDFQPSHDLIKRKASEVSSRGSTTHLSPTPAKLGSRSGSARSDLLSKQRSFLRVRSRKRAGSEDSPSPHSPADGRAATLSVFDMPLDEVCALHHTRIPIHLQRLVQELDGRALDEEGLYRLPGARSGLDRLRAAIVADPVNCDLGPEAYPDCHVLSGIIKDYIRNLPDPLLTAEAYGPLMSAMTATDDEARLDAIKAVLLGLPAVNVRTLDFMLRHLQEVVAHEAHNKMKVLNVALIFGPTMIRPAVETPVTMLSDMASKNKLVELLITHRKALLFQSDHETSDMAFFDSHQSADTFTTAPSSSSNSARDPDEHAGYIDVEIETDAAVRDAQPSLSALSASAAAGPETTIAKRPSYHSAMGNQPSLEDRVSVKDSVSSSPSFHVVVHESPGSQRRTSTPSDAASDSTVQGDRPRSSSHPTTPILPTHSKPGTPSATSTFPAAAVGPTPPRYPSPLHVVAGSHPLRNAHSVDNGHHALGINPVTPIASTTQSTPGSLKLSNSSGIQRGHRPPSYSKVTRLSSGGAVSIDVDQAVADLAKPIFVDDVVADDGLQALPVVNQSSKTGEIQGEEPGQATSSSPTRQRRIRSLNLKALGKESTL